MRVLFDTDVLLDLLLDRAPHADAAARLLSRVESGHVAGYVCATAVTTIHYLARRAVGTKPARQQIERLLALLEVAPVNRTVLQGALALPFSDFEDAVTHEAARQAGVDAIVTRNLKDFRKTIVPAYAPAGLLALLDAQPGRESDPAD